MFHPTAKTTMCHIRTQQGTNLYENTHAFQWPGAPPSNADLSNLATQVGTGALVTALRSVLHQTVVFREVYCRNIDTENANNGTYIFPTGVTGARGGSAVAANEACGVVKRTGLTGRGSHGRMSVSGFSEGDVDGNTVGSSIMALLINLALQLLVDYTAGTTSFTAALAHIPRILGPAGTSTPLVECVVVDNNVDSQKTRLNAHGR